MANENTTNVNLPVEKTPIPLNSVAMPAVPVSPAARPNMIPFLLVGMVALILLFSGGAYYLGTKKINSPSAEKTNTVPETLDTPVTPTAEPSVSTVKPEPPRVAGKLKRVTRNLKIFKTSEVSMIL